jgi:cation transport regulator ChaB
MHGGKSKAALILALKPKKEGKEEEDKGGDYSEAKLTAASAVRKALEGDDDEALSDALESFVSACS